MSSNNNSVPSGVSSAKGTTAAGNGQKNVDSIVMYCSYFTYCDDQAKQRQHVTHEIDAKSIISRVENAQSKSYLFFFNINE